MKKRIEWLDFGKAFFMALVVLAHALKSIYSRSIYSPKIILCLQSIGNVIFFIIMPAFFALSGYLYRESENWHQFRHMVLKKLINLGVPYIVFSCIYVFMQQFSSDVNTKYDYKDLLFLWYHPISYLWFLYILFFIFILVDFLNLMKVNYKWQFWLDLLFFLIIAFLKLKPFVLQTFGWATFFLVGYFINDHIKAIEKNKRKLFWITGLLSLLGLLECFIILGPRSDFNNLYIVNIIPKIVVAFFSVVMCINLNKNSLFFRYFRQYGSSSLIIYMIHPPLISVVCVLMFKFATPNVVLSVLILFFVGWFGSMIVVWLNNRWNWLQFIFNSYHAFQRLRN